MTVLVVICNSNKKHVIFIYKDAAINKQARYENKEIPNGWPKTIKLQNKIRLIIFVRKNCKIQYNI